MFSFLEPLRELNVFSIVVRCLLAAILSGIIGMQRGKHGRAAGLRTHILVSIGAALTAMLGLYITEFLGYTSDPMRLGAQVISGIGFLGVGTILIKGDAKITGLTTAAGLWATASIGLACGSGFYEGALIVAIIVILTFTILIKVEFNINKRVKQIYIYLEISDTNKVTDVVDHIRDNYKPLSLQVIPPRSNTSGQIGVTVCINTANLEDGEDKIKKLSSFDGVSFAVESF